MRNRTIIVLLSLALMGTGAMTASAQFRLDANIAWPLVGGIKLDPTVFGSGGGSIDLSQYHFLLPGVQAYYQFGEGTLRAGLGARIYTVIIESLVYPEAYLELELRPFVLNATLGGCFFGVFGLATNGSFVNLMLPDLSVGWALNDWFRIGAGVLMFAPIDANWVQNFGYIGYINARFSFLFK